MQRERTGGDLVAVDAERLGRHSDQERLVRHLSEVMRRRLAGEDPEGALLVDHEPREKIVLGVLPPRRDIAVFGAHPDLGEEPGVPIDVLPPSEMGLTLLVSPAADDVAFQVRCRFALYLQQYPRYPEQSEYLQRREIAVSLRQTSAASETVRLRTVFRRYDVDVSFQISVPIPQSAESVEKRAVQPFNEAIEATFQRALREDRLYLPLTGRGQTIPQRVVLEGQEAFEHHLQERAGPLEDIARPHVAFSLAADRDAGSPNLRVNLTLENVTEETEGVRGYHPSLMLFDAGFEAQVASGNLQNFGFGFAETDYRVKPHVHSHGRFCVGQENLEEGRVWTTTWPTYRQPVVESRREFGTRFDELIANPVETLEQIARGMENFDGEWKQFLKQTLLEDSTRAASQAQRGELRDEIRRFRLGIDLIKPGSATYDERLAKAFVWMNEAFLSLNSPRTGTHEQGEGARIDSWYLFQLVFIVCGLLALAAREAQEGHPLREELEFADVLWFPTGGGKSEAFLGLVAVALFYDRLRGKDAGTTALIRFPLRMLSVQQLERVLGVVVASEEVRLAHAQDEAIALGGSFELGYFVGRQNTPNRITDPHDEKWGDLRAMARRAERDPDWRRNKVVITSCPRCGSQTVELRPDLDAVRLHHWCTTCDTRLPVVVSDDEVYRTLPGVVVATVDKLATVAFNSHFSHLTHGARFSCPDHGYVTYPRGFRAERHCLARRFCTRDPETEWRTVLFYDPAPALVVQDELHLLSEELGTFSAHYETLWRHLTKVSSGKPSKVVAASATISDYDHHIRHLYALRPRRFPSEGFTAERSFYIAERSELARRLFVGALPFGVRPAQLAVISAEAYRDELNRLRNMPAAQVANELDLQHLVSEEAVTELLTRYELQLFYVNRKTDGDRVGEDIERLGPRRGRAPLNVEVLNGETPLPHISAVIRRIQAEDPSIPEEDRLAAVVGTSLVSHGVDLGRINAMHVAGMTSTIAYYVQATARAGRTDVGLIAVSFGRTFARDRAVFHFFDPHHRYQDYLVEPVSLNRFSLQAPDKTASGLIASIIVQQVARDPAWNPQGLDLSLTDNFERWAPQQSMGLEDYLREQLHSAYGLDSDVLDPVLRERFRDIVDRRFEEEWAELRASRSRQLVKCFQRKPVSSFRDIDDPAEFGPVGHLGRDRFRLLSGGADPREDPNQEVVAANEAGEADGA